MLDRINAVELYKEEVGKEFPLLAGLKVLSQRPLISEDLI